MVEVGLMLVCGFVAAMAVLDDGVKQVLEDRVGLLIAGHTAHRHDEGVTCGVGLRSALEAWICDGCRCPVWEKGSFQGPGKWSQRC